MAYWLQERQADRPYRKSTGRGIAGKQRRKIFAEEYAYWMKWTWLTEGKAVRDMSERVAKMTFEEIKVAQAIKKIKEEAEHDETETALALNEI